MQATQLYQHSSKADELITLFRLFSGLCITRFQHQSKCIYLQPTQLPEFRFDVNEYLSGRKGVHCVSSQKNYSSKAGGKEGQTTLCKQVRDKNFQKDQNRNTLENLSPYDWKLNPLQKFPLSCKCSALEEKQETETKQKRKQTKNPQQRQNLAAALCPL